MENIGTPSVKLEPNLNIIMSVKQQLFFYMYMNLFV